MEKMHFRLGEMRVFSIRLDGQIVWLCWYGIQSTHSLTFHTNTFEIYTIYSFSNKRIFMEHDIGNSVHPFHHRVFFTKVVLEHWRPLCQFIPECIGKHGVWHDVDEVRIFQQCQLDSRVGWCLGGGLR